MSSMKKETSFIALLKRSSLNDSVVSKGSHVYFKSAQKNKVREPLIVLEAFVFCFPCLVMSSSAKSLSQLLRC